ncbi:MAG: prepilin peptidase [Candidatus Aenigmatarchaeota archaeon]
MFEIIGLLIAFFGSSLAAAFDLKITPTEIPDEIPHAMITLALILACLKSLLDFSVTPLIESFLYGGLLLAFGFLMYRFGQWGGGDAKVLAAVGFFSPLISPLFGKIHFHFAFSYLVNVFIVGAAYMIFYAFALAFLNKKIFFEFGKNVKSNSKILLISILTLILLFPLTNIFLFNLFNLPSDFYSIFSNSLLISLLCLGLFLLWIFTRTVEEVAFKRRTPVSKLKVGDVLLESKIWEGITEKELKKIKRSGKKFVWIKEGVRFAPTFPLALIFTLLFGDGILIFIHSLF